MQLKIKHKLFSVIIFANLIVVLGIYALTNYSFSRSFREYLDTNQVSKLMPLNIALTEIYKTKNNWIWANDRTDPTWNDLMEEYVLGDIPQRPVLQRERRRPPQSENKVRSRSEPRLRDKLPREKPPLDGGNIRGHIILADINKNILIGRVNSFNDVFWMDIKIEEKLIGYLGFFKTTEITDELDQLLIKKLKNNLSWSLVFIILVSAVIAMLVSRLLVKPILVLRSATKNISEGHFDKKIVITSQDEIGELSADFNLLTQTLKDNLNARQQWISDISHELRTPVAILQGELEAIQDGVRETNQASINSLHQEVKRLALLINDLHELSLSDNGALSYSFEKLDVVALINNVLELKNEALEKNNFTINHHSKNTHPINIMGDQHRLTQLFLNLLTNSLAYSHKGGIIDISYLILKDKVSICWADSEPGVSDEELTKLFERLYRVESSRNRDLGGSGLGLSIVQNIVAAHHGSIKAFHSEFGGVEFKLVLPLC